MDFPGGSDDKESACNAGYLGLIPGSNIWVGKIPWRRNGYSPQYSCLENLMGRTWQAKVHGSQRVRHDWMTKHTQAGYNKLNKTISTLRKILKSRRNTAEKSRMNLFGILKMLNKQKLKRNIFISCNKLLQI